MLIPDRRLFLAASLWFAFGVVVAFCPTLLDLWLAAAGVWLLLAAGDGHLARQRCSRLLVRREVAHAMPVGTWQNVRLVLQTSTGGGASGWLLDGYPAAFVSEGLPLRFALAPGQSLRVGYRLRIGERGRQIFDGVTLRWSSPLRFWLVQERVAVRDEVRVYPDFARIAHYTLLATDNRLAQIGILHRRRRGEGMEFQQLRDYRQDDSPRQIDWKASSRAGRLISREYTDERDQQIVFLLDCSARMRARDGDLSHFDHALNALLLLAWVALHQGDSVGLVTLGHPRPRVLAPARSVATVNTLLNAVYDLEPSLQVPDYLNAAELLDRRLRKRALILLVTNLRDEDDDTLLPALRHLRIRHAVSVASLREPIIDEVLSAPIGGFDDALTRAAGLEYLQSRRRQLTLLRRDGAQILDVGAQGLPVALINHYWARKRAGTL
ncbi:DUF58 domain-containing protein [Accumulibacter sp.]|uniref:DUF58 domain-containing protein n=1 Tax=Accumulibacter sp. TaxID=2053492 RepID=UPI0025F3B58D|nr:DUF58 domain-containing protein [Accumulibacter sp.]MCM8595211.1 DUF58 domain-containing protein [Accumulibacter sp.]MCM8625175.1 DUF58 domain-containing protein [Accumulibacter sp.]MDS4049357.1 DUF58 domain-containing protein [Accumulibacter sp.]